MKVKKLLNASDRLRELRNEARKEGDHYAEMRSQHSIPQAYMSNAFRAGYDFAMEQIKKEIKK